MNKNRIVVISRPDSEIKALTELYVKSDLGRNPSIHDIVDFAIQLANDKANNRNMAYLPSYMQKFKKPEKFDELDEAKRFLEIYKDSFIKCKGRLFALNGSEWTLIFKTDKHGIRRDRRGYEIRIHDEGEFYDFVKDFLKDTNCEHLSNKAMRLHSVLLSALECDNRKCCTKPCEEYDKQLKEDLKRSFEKEIELGISKVIAIDIGIKNE